VKHLYNTSIDRQNGYMLAEYMQEEMRGSALERTPNKREQKQPNEQYASTKGVESFSNMLASTAPERCYWYEHCSSIYQVSCQ